MKYIIIATLAFLQATILQAQTTSEKRPQDRAHHSGVYDPQLKSFVIYGGYVFVGDKQKPAGDVWAWNGKDWNRIGNTERRRIIAPLAFDDKRQRLVAFGGSDTIGTDGKLSVFESGHWRILTDSQAMERGDAGLVYDRKRDRLVLFGGVNQEHQFLGDTWEFDGKQWTKVSSSGPSPRSGVAITYDAARGKTVLYGGFAPNAELSDTWEWDGKSWTQINQEGPGPRAWPCFAYDAKNKRAVLFGGEDNKDSRMYTDTWAWNGKTWKKLANDGPRGRIQFVMDYDRLRNKVVLFGGFTMPPHYLNDTWEFDGAVWKQTDK